MQRDQFLAEVDAILAELGNRTHYDVLGVPQDASSQDIRHAFHGMAKKFHVDAHPDLKADDAVRDKLQKVFGAINEAQRVLGNPARRQEYDENLAAGDAAAAGAEVEAILRADELFRLAKRLVERGDLSQARSNLNTALELNPDEPQFLAWSEWAKYGLLDKLPKGKAVDKERAGVKVRLRKLVEENENCADAHLFLGHVARNDNDAELAEQSYRRVLELRPKHPVATSNLRLIRTRKKNTQKGFLAKLFGK